MHAYRNTLSTETWGKLEFGWFFLISGRIIFLYLASGSSSPHDLCVSFLTGPSSSLSSADSSSFSQRQNRLSQAGSQTSLGTRTSQPASWQQISSACSQPPPVYPCFGLSCELQKDAHARLPTTLPVYLNRHLKLKRGPELNSRLALQACSSQWQIHPCDYSSPNP